jgi:hypothetical protein
MDTQFAIYNISTVVYGAAELAEVGGSIVREKNLNSFEVTNIGDTIAFVNDKILYPGIPGTFVGDSISFGEASGKVYKGVIKIKFAAPAGVLPQVEVSQLYYL